MLVYRKLIETEWSREIPDWHWHSLLFKKSGISTRHTPEIYRKGSWFLFRHFFIPAFPCSKRNILKNIFPILLWSETFLFRHLYIPAILFWNKNENYLKYETNQNWTISHLFFLKQKCKLSYRAANRSFLYLLFGRVLISFVIENKENW